MQDHASGVDDRAQGDGRYALDFGGDSLVEGGGFERGGSRFGVARDQSAEVGQHRAGDLHHHRAVHPLALARHTRAAQKFVYRRNLSEQSRAWIRAPLSSAIGRRLHSPGISAQAGQQSNRRGTAFRLRWASEGNGRACGSGIV